LAVFLREFRGEVLQTGIKIIDFGSRVPVRGMQKRAALNLEDNGKSRSASILGKSCQNRSPKGSGR
jgi:hypothetical protein